MEKAPATASDQIRFQLDLLRLTSMTPASDASAETVIESLQDLLRTATEQVPAS